LFTKERAMSDNEHRNHPDSALICLMMDIHPKYAIFQHAAPRI
jgi:hypothetical protein